jgi:hypothetical protein
MNKRILLPFLMLLIFGSAHAQSADESAPATAKAVLVIDHPEILQQAARAAKAKADGKDEKEAKELQEPPSSPPLDTDDTGTPGKKGVEINFIGECDRTPGSRECEAVIDANWGIGENIQFKVERPYEVERSDDEPTQRGMGPTEVGIKYRFYNKGGFSAAVYPNYTIDNAAKHRDADGNIIEGEGDSAYFPIIFQVQTGKLAIVTNVGYRRVFKDHESDSITTGLAVSGKIDEKTTGMAEVSRESDKHFKKKETDVRVGFIRLMVPKSRFGEQSLFASIGKSVGKTEDGKTHTLFRFGWKFEK